MQKAIFTAQIALVLAVFVPGLTDVLGLVGTEIGAEGWGIAFVGPIVVCILCELYKLVVAEQIKRLNAQIAKDQVEPHHKLTQAESVNACVSMLQMVIEQQKEQDAAFAETKKGLADLKDILKSLPQETQERSMARL